MPAGRPRYTGCGMREQQSESSSGRSRIRHSTSESHWSSDGTSSFPSRRRHTRSDRDWSSDVCSSDLGVVGLMRTLALELAPDFIRVNSVHPTSVNTDMIQNAATYELFAPDLTPEQRTKEVLGERFQTLNALPIRWGEPRDISNAVLFLASDAGRYITGITLPVDAGSLLK